MAYGSLTTISAQPQAMSDACNNDLGILNKRSTFPRNGCQSSWSFRFRLLNLQFPLRLKERVHNEDLQ
jgi:hypothetical protein